MNSTIARIVCRFLIASLMLMSLGTARAGMIGVDQLGATSGASADRAAVMTLLARNDVASQLQSQGVDPAMARARVAALTDAEVSGLKGQIDALPAGASSHSGYWWAGAVVIAVIIWYLWFR